MKINKNNKKGQRSPKLSERLLEIGRDCAKRLKKSLRSTAHGNHLYDKEGLPK